MIGQAPSTSPEIGPMVEADLDRVMDIERQSFKTPWGRHVFQEELGREWAILWVLRPAPGGPVAGFVNFWLVRDEIHILNVAVDPQFRRCRYATELLQRTIEFAWKKRVRYLTLEVRRSNHGAIELYNQLAFKPIGIRPNYYSDNREDAIVMLLTLGVPSS